MLALTFLISVPQTAHAKTACQPLLDKIESTPREELVSLLEEVIQCDKSVLDRNYKLFVRASGDVDTLTALSLKAIELEAYSPIWASLEKLKDYKAREKVASTLGAMCEDNKHILPFLQGGYFAMRGRAFGMWTPAFTECPSEGLTNWMVEQAAKPPSRNYDEKYNALLNALIERQGASAIKSLEPAAIAASKVGGPFATVLDKMRDAVKPTELGAKVSPENQAALIDAYERIGSAGIKPEDATKIADKLYQDGFKDKAAELLPSVYADRLRPDGSLLYAVSSVESCDGRAVVHVATVSEPAKRWVIQGDVEAPARAFKPRLKCKTEGDWPVLTTGPLQSEDELEAWATSQAQVWTDKKLDVKVRTEKPITLP